MWNVTVDIDLTIEGCPNSGLEAIDFRTEHGIVPAPHNTIRLQRMDLAASESICRRYPDLLTEKADLCIKTETPRISFTAGDSVIYLSACPLTISPDLAATLQLSECLDRIAEAIHEYQEEDDRLKQERAEADQRKVTDRIQELEAMSDAELVALFTVETEVIGKPYPHRHIDNPHAMLLAQEAPYAKFPFAGACEHAKPLAARILKAIADHNRLVDARVSQWINEEGSQRLKQLAQEGIEFGAVYRDEYHDWFVDQLYEGWSLLQDTTLEVFGKPRNSSVEELEELDEARTSYPSAKLVYYCFDTADTQDDDAYAWTGSLPTTTVDGFECVYNAPDEAFTVESDEECVDID